MRTLLDFPLGALDHAADSGLGAGELGHFCGDERGVFGLDGLVDFRGVVIGVENRVGFESGLG